jgi:hypothetical protein
LPHAARPDDRRMRGQRKALSADGKRDRMTGSERGLINDWCQQP